MNERIERYRQVALDALQPSEADLEHGLELHEHSLVCDSYGFAPRAAIDGDEMARAIEEGASEAELKDMREDMTMTRWATDEREKAEFMEAWEAAGVTCIMQNAGEEGQSVKRMVKRLARFTWATDLMSDFITRAITPDDIVEAHENGKRCLYFSTNGVPLDEQWVSVEEELRYVRIFFQLGARMMHLTYNRRNMIGDGCAEPANGGLSDFGREAVRKLNEVGIIVDCAHSSWQTSLDAAHTSELPMVASHSGAAAVNAHHRCKPDEVIKAIVDTGGYVGVCCIPAFLGGTGDINALLDHVDYIAQNFGPDHVTIGTDVAYTPPTYDEEVAKLPDRPSTREEFRTLWEPDDPLHDPEWRKPEMKDSLAWTNWPLFTVGLVQRGYSDEDIQKIIGGNCLRVASAVLPDCMG
ncbi:MAG: membrane dipeptidase [Armatimonadota bacterium]